MSYPRAFFTICLVVCCLLLLAPTVLAGISEPVIALHAKAHTTKGVTICSTWAPNDIDCTEFTTSARTGVAYDVYVVGVNPLPGPSGSSIGGLRWAIDYNGESQRGVDVFSWIGCADGEYSWDTWPMPRTGNTLAWIPQNCQINQPGASGAQAVAGAFYIYAYSEDIFSVAPFYGWLTDNEGHWIGWQEPELGMVDCQSNSLFPDLLTGRSAVRFSGSGTELGFNPCTGEGELPPYGPPDPPITPPPPPPPPKDQKATILLHVALSGNRGGTCADAPSLIDSVRTSAPYSTPGTLYDVFLLATPQVPDDPVGIGIIQMGIDYSPSLHVQSWISCASQIVTNEWPASGTGNTLIFDGCNSGEIEVAGYFQVAIYDPSFFRIIGHPQTGVAKWASCSSGDQVFEDLTAGQVGWISLGGAAIGQDNDGCNPALESCAPGPVPAHPTTWGKLKTKY
jgi:hypothetical protein